MNNFNIRQRNTCYGKTSIYRSYNLIEVFVGIVERDRRAYWIDQNDPNAYDACIASYNGLYLPIEYIGMVCHINDTNGIIVVCKKQISKTIEQEMKRNGYNKILEFY